MELTYKYLKGDYVNVVDDGHSYPGMSAQKDILGCRREHLKGNWNVGSFKVIDGFIHPDSFVNVYFVSNGVHDCLISEEGIKLNLLSIRGREKITNKIL